jgi:hypothetical protein
MLSAKFGCIWPSSFRGEDFFNISQSETRIALGGHICSRKNLITYLGVIALFSSNFQNLNTFRFLFKKL